MSLVQDAVSAMKKVILLNDKVERSANEVEKITSKLIDHQMRIVKLETLMDLAISRAPSIKKLD